jgi:molecular chaperone GrpE
MNSHEPEVPPAEEEDLELPEVAGTDDGGEEGGDDSAALEADVLKWKELAMRTAADHENYRKRAAREREDAVRYSNQSLLEELLPILDNFEMGMQAASQDQSSMIYVGMDMVRKQLAEFLASCGAVEIASEGKAFDPNIHEAVSQEVADGVEDGTIIRVMRRGFMLRDRLLRPATVVVAKSAEENDTEDN